MGKEDVTGDSLVVILDLGFDVVDGIGRLDLIIQNLVECPRKSIQRYKIHEETNRKDLHFLVLDPSFPV